ncbi:MAG: hypothetical protein NC131_07580 [Roseburia sp.]|nr:hypothetical protein [Roseburia sp.]
MSENKFVYNYSAPTEDERREIEDIKKQYSGEQVKRDNLTRLRELDRRVKMPPLILSIVLGVVGVLVFGTGLTMVLEWLLYAWGIVVAAVGVALTACAYPIRKLLEKRGKARYGDEILQLSEQLLNGNK